MRLTKIWLVRDPGPDSELADCCHEAESPIELCHIFMGTGLARWKGENTVLYTEEGEAKRDALSRFKRMGFPVKMASRTADSKLPVRPFHMWVEDVVRESGIHGAFVEEIANSPEWRKRLKLWYNTGETVAGAAEMLHKWPKQQPSATPTGRELKELRDHMEHFAGTHAQRVAS